MTVKGVELVGEDLAGVMKSLVFERASRAEEGAK
jgi:hypothetical protein